MNENKTALDTMKSWSIIAGATSVAIMCSAIGFTIIADQIKERREENKKHKEQFSIKFKRPSNLKSYSQIDVRINGEVKYFNYEDVENLDGDTIEIPLRLKESLRPTVVNKAVLYHYNDWALRLDILCDEKMSTKNSISINVDYVSDSLYMSRVLVLQSKTDSILDAMRSIEGGIRGMAKVGWIFERDSGKIK